MGRLATKPMVTLGGHMTADDRTFRDLFAEIERKVREGVLNENEALQTLEDLKNGMFSRGMIVDQEAGFPTWMRVLERGVSGRRLFSEDTVELVQTGAEGTILDSVKWMSERGVDPMGIATYHGAHERHRQDSRRLEGTRAGR